MNREQKRRNERLIKNLAEKAKKDMIEWVQNLDHDPTPYEITAFRAGYLAGVNRFDKD